MYQVIYEIQISLHSTMVLLKLYFQHFYCFSTCTFTFHYGLIKTKGAFGLLWDSISFTFHYGLIKTQDLMKSGNGYLSLHSTMVLLKLIVGAFISFFFYALHSTMVLLKLESRSL